MISSASENSGNVFSGNSISPCKLTSSLLLSLSPNETQLPSSLSTVAVYWEHGCGCLWKRKHVVGFLLPLHITSRMKKIRAVLGWCVNFGSLWLPRFSMPGNKTKNPNQPAMNSSVSYWIQPKDFGFCIAYCLLMWQRSGGREKRKNTSEALMESVVYNDNIYRLFKANFLSCRKSYISEVFELFFAAEWCPRLK